MKIMLIAGYLLCIVTTLCWIGSMNKVPLGDLSIIRTYGDIGLLLVYSGLFGVIFWTIWDTYCKRRNTK